MSHQPSLPTRVSLVERDVSRHDRELDNVVPRVAKLERRMDVLAAKVAIFAAIGAAVGGAVIVAIARAFIP